MTPQAQKPVEKPKEEEVGSWSKFAKWYINWATGDPATKQKTEKVLEWLPITGSLISIRDTSAYYKDGHYVAGSLMAGATGLSIAGDVALVGLALTGLGLGAVVSAPAAEGGGAGPAAGAAIGTVAGVGVKMETAAGSQLLRWGAKEVIIVGRKLAEARVKREITMRAATLSEKEIEKVALEAVQFVARSKIGKELTEKSMLEIVREVTKAGKIAAQKYVQAVSLPVVEKDLAALSSKQAARYLRLLANKAWEEAADISGRGIPLVGPAYNAAKAALTQQLGKVEKAKTFLKGAVTGEPMKYTMKAAERAAETAKPASSSLVKSLTYVASVPEIAASGALDLARITLKGGGWIIQKAIIEPGKKLITAAPKRLVLETTALREGFEFKTQDAVKKENAKRAEEERKRASATPARTEKKAPQAKPTPKEMAPATTNVETEVTKRIDELAANAGNALNGDVAAEIAGRISKLKDPETLATLRDANAVNTTVETMLNTDYLYSADAKKRLTQDRIDAVMGR